MTDDGAGQEMSPAQLVRLPDEQLLERVQRQSFGFFWEGGAHESGLPGDRRPETGPGREHLAAVGGSGFAIMAIVVAVERGWITRAAALERLERMTRVLTRATR